MGTSNSTHPADEAKDSMKDAYLTVSQKASDGTRLVKEGISEGKEVLKVSISDGKEVFREAVSDGTVLFKEKIGDRAEILKEAFTSKKENLQRSWKLAQQALETFRYARGTITKQNIIVLIFVIGGTSLFIYFLKWQMERYELRKRRKRKWEQRKRAIDLLTEKLESSEVSILIFGVYPFSTRMQDSNVSLLLPLTLLNLTK